jgi:hypothetical protein
MLSGIVVSVITVVILSFGIGSSIHWYSFGSKYCTCVPLISSDAIPMSIVPNVKNLEEKKLKVQFQN